MGKERTVEEKIEDLMGRQADVYALKDILRDFNERLKKLEELRITLSGGDVADPTLKTRA